MAAGKRAVRPEPTRRAVPAHGRHRAVKPRYGRIVAVTIAAVVTLVAVVGGFGWFPRGHSPSASAATQLQPVAAAATTPSPSSRTSSGQNSTLQARKVTSSTSSRTTSIALPAGSGHGRRIVFSQSEQRVWLVNPNDAVRRTYLVSGSLTDNLDPGTFQVFSRSRWAVGVDNSGVMQYFVRFTHGPTGAAIGFHTIPTKLGKAAETVAQLGTPRSHGCIRQATPDAIALWDFAPDGTTVVVTD